MSYVGQSLKRFEDPRLVTGKGTYVDDLHPPGLLHVVFLRSPYAHARIKSIDIFEAKSHPGVVAVLTGDDVAHLGAPARHDDRMEGEWALDELNMGEEPVLARGKVRYVGEAVAAVVADKPTTARDAVELIRADYEPLRPYIDAYDAISEDAEPIHEELKSNVGLRVSHDDQGAELDEAFAKADRIVEGRFRVPRVTPVPMETRGCLAHFDPAEDRLTVWPSSQGPHRYRDPLAALLGWSEDKVRVIMPDVGGSYGEKGGVFPEDVVVAYASCSLGKPLKWVADRQENMLGFAARSFGADVEVAVKNDGTILGLKARIVADLGAFFAPHPPVRFSHRIMGPYKTPTARIEVIGAITNKPRTGSYRAIGGAESALCMERTMDLIALELKLDPVEVRRKNLVPSDAFPFRTATNVTYDSGDYERGLDQVLELADYSGWKEKARASKDGTGPLIGVGVATCVKQSGSSGAHKTEKGWIRIDKSGKVTALTGVFPHGQGTDVAYAQIVADQLGVTPYDVTVVHGDTALVESGRGTGASRGTPVGGVAIFLAAQEAGEKLRRIAGHLLGCSPDEVVLEEGYAHDRRQPDKRISFQKVAEAAYSEELLPPDVEVGLETSAEYTIPGFRHNPHSFCAHVAAVEVDRDTGDVSILKYVAVNDCGVRINPMLVDGQTHGSIAQGIGQALIEEMAYDSDGQPLTGSLLDYAMPTAEGIPSMTTDSFETPSPLNPLGIKGVAELDILAAPSVVANAVMDALSNAGVRHIDTPLTPEKVWRALHGHNS